MSTNQPPLIDLNNLPQRTLRTGAALSATSVAAIIVASVASTGKPLAALNSISHFVYGDDCEIGDGLSIRDTWAGLAANTSAMFFWALLYELIPGRRSVAALIVPAVVGTGVAYVVDYHVVPKRLAPGFERVLGGAAIGAIYGVFAVTLALSSLWNRRSTGKPL